MQRLLLVLMAVMTIHFSSAQTGSHWKTPSKESQAYREQREKMSTPCFGYDKVLLAKITEDKEGNQVVDKKTYQSFGLRDKFAYNMKYGESYSQICDVDPPIQNEHKKIFGHLPSMFFEYEWSERQLKFFSSHRDSVMALMKMCIKEDKFVGLNYKHTIVEINAVEMIPFLIKTYNEERKDHDILTVLLLLMEKNEYPPFMASTSHTKLYTVMSNYYESYLVLSPGNQELIIKRATDFYNGRHK